jgi:hypothetical protein
MLRLHRSPASPRHRRLPRPSLLALVSLALTVLWLALADAALASPAPDAAAPAVVARDQTPPPKPPGGGPGGRDIQGGIRALLDTVSATGVAVVGAVFTAVAVVGGLLIITAGSNGRRSEAGQAFLWSGVVGLFVVLMASTFAEELVRLFGG